MICPRCQTINPDTNRFCSNCGQALEAPTAPRPAEGERKLVTVLFADVVGSTAMGERLDPELVTEVMNGAFAFMNRAVDRYGGTVSRLMGDAILAIFGAPAAHEDDPERAIRAGLEIQAAARDYAGAMQRQYGVDFNVRVGIHTGLAVLDQVGDRIRTEYTAMGDTPNVAARMQSAAVPGSVLVSADTHRLAWNVFDFETRGPLAVKGKSAPIEAWQVIGLRAAPASARGLEGLRAPLVGRAAELNRLRQRLSALQPGQPGGWVTLTGEAGLGKSRLVAEARASLPEGSLSLEGRCISYGSAISYLAWRQILRQSIGAPEGEPAEAVRARLEYSACECCHMPGGDLPFLEAMLAVASEDSLQVVLGSAGDELVRRITDAVQGFLCGLAQTQPTVVVFEDLHWADEASLALLEQVCQVTPRYPLLFIAVMRSDHDTAAWALAERVRQKLPLDQAEEIALEPLAPDESRHLLALLLQIEDLPERVRGLILENAEGNPFFVEEVIRSLLDSGHIVNERGYWRATREIEKVAIPNTLAGLLAARMDALPEAAKRVAQLSAVIGRTFSFRVLETVFNAAPPAERLDIEPPLALLARQEIILAQASAPAPEREYTFKHALTQQAAYNSLLLRRRREFHGRVGRALEGLYAARLDEVAPTLAHHFWEAEDWAPAAEHARRAGEAAYKIYALREAIHQYDRALAALDKAGGEPGADTCDVILAWARAANKFRPYAEQLERLLRAEQIARRLGDKRRLAEALHAIGSVHLARGHSMLAVPVLNEAFTLAEELGDEALATFPSFHAAMVKMDTDPQAALAMFDRTAALARKYGIPDLEAYALSVKGMALARLGRFAESQAVETAAIDIVHAGGSPVTESDIELFAGWAYLDMGDTPAGLAHGQRGVACAVATDNFDCICAGLACVGFGHMQSGHLSDAAEAFEHSIEQTRLSGAVRFEVLARGGLALAHMAAGQPSAMADLEQAASRADEIHDPFTEALFLHALAQAHLAQGDLPAAQTYLDKALAYYQRNNLGPYLVRALETQAALKQIT